MKRVGRRLGWILLILVLGCAAVVVAALARLLLKPGHIIIERRPDPAYEKLFPYYVELCAGSQFRAKLTGEGGLAGHAVMYLKGACREEDAPFPQLRRCRVAATRLDDPEHGVGISVNRWFKNVNWVAIPGYHLFFDGNLKPDEPLTQTQFEAVEQQAIDRGLFKGIAFHDYPGAESDADRHVFLERHSIGTDFALQFSRTVFCARLPITSAMMDQVIAFLNDKNREYAEGKANYNWSVWADNCSHTLRNALAAANIWSPLSVRAIKIRQIFNLAIPANEFVNLAELMTHDDDRDDYRALLDDGPRRDAFHEFLWLPTEPGALLKTLPVHAPNELYDTSFRLFTLQSPFLLGNTQRAIDLLSEPRFVDLDVNLQYFAEKYDAILARLDEERDTMASVRGTPYRRVAQLYAGYIHKQRDEVRTMEGTLASVESSKPPAAK